MNEPSAVVSDTFSNSFEISACIVLHWLIYQLQHHNKCIKHVISYFAPIIAGREPACV